MRKAVVTTFPIDDWDVYVKDMITSFDANWPRDIDLYISLDCVPEDRRLGIQNEIGAITYNTQREFYICNEFSDEQKEFYKRTVDSPDTGYRFQVCKFSHKIFALMTAANFCKDYDCLIWLDADVITNRPITHEVLERDALPRENEVVSYLGRTEAPHSECGFVGYRLDRGAYGFIEEMYNYYVTDRVLTLPGWTDCDVFDSVNKSYQSRNLSAHVKKDMDKKSDGWNVWDFTVLGEYMTHNKGQRKFKVKQQKVFAADNMQIKTRNCLPKEDIQDNVRKNLTLINKWVDYVKPHDEPLVMCSGGSSLAYTDIKPWADKGVKIVAVKHAIDRLKGWGIKPWACVLLDPRAHVEEFVKKPDKDVIYFVASMVNPSVTETLLKEGCTVVGYHAFVGAGEDKLLTSGTLMVSGGSATATRSLGLFHECLGFKEFHCYGYDLCYYTRPDFALKNEDGSDKYIEITLSSQSWGRKPHQRTFWTEGQFLAQAQELHDLYKAKQQFNIHLYGQGIAAWQQHHFKQAKAWVDDYEVKIEKKKAHSITLGDWEYATRTG